MREKFAVEGWTLIQLEDCDDAPTRLDDPARPGVRLATMHRAKGLEFHHVAICSLEAGVVPPPMAVNGAVDAVARRSVLDREKSLVQVAATRAKNTLRVSWSGKRSDVLPQS